LNDELGDAAVGREKITPNAGIGGEQFGALFSPPATTLACGAVV